jgi:hypothetical protein
MENLLDSLKDLPEIRNDVVHEDNTDLEKTKKIRVVYIQHINEMINILYE